MTLLNRTRITRKIKDGVYLKFPDRNSNNINKNNWGTVLQTNVFGRTSDVIEDINFDQLVMERAI